MTGMEYALLNVIPPAARASMFGVSIAFRAVAADPFLAQIIGHNIEDVWLSSRGIGSQPCGCRTDNDREKHRCGKGAVKRRCHHHISVWFLFLQLPGLKAQQHLSLGQRPRIISTLDRTLSAEGTAVRQPFLNSLRSNTLRQVKYAFSVRIPRMPNLGRCPRLRCFWAFSPIKSTARERRRHTRRAPVTLQGAPSSKRSTMDCSFTSRTSL